MTGSRTAEFWRRDGVRHTMPATGECFPGGFDPRPILAELALPGPVVELGCGFGRLAEGFEPSRYLGLDVNPAAIREARRYVPAHRFEVIDDAASLPPAETIFAYAVLVHVADEDVEDLIGRMCAAAPCVVVAEIMDRRWRGPGDPPVFNRDPEEYVLHFGRFGFALTRSTKRVYKRYESLDLNRGRDCRLTFHRYLREAGSAAAAR